MVNSMINATACNDAGKCVQFLNSVLTSAAMQIPK
jgi:hypothetical protein